MFRVVVVLTTCALLLSSCGSLPPLKRSANNSLIDFTGFKGKKRAPLYNKKYINIAKKKVVEEEDDDDEYYSDDDDLNDITNASLDNKRMYLDMIKEDMQKKRAQNSKSKQKSYPTLSQAQKSVDQSNASHNPNSEVIKDELAQIRQMLHETQEDLAKYKCPMQQAEEQKREDLDMVIKHRPLSNSSESDTNADDNNLDNKAQPVDSVNQDTKDDTDSDSSNSSAHPEDDLDRNPYYQQIEKDSQDDKPTDDSTLKL